MSTQLGTTQLGTTQLGTTQLGATEPLTAISHRAARSPGPMPWRAATLVGVFGFSLSILGSWIPSLWGDEAASIMSAERSWPSLFRMLGNIDAVHGTYYALLHLWIDVFGASTFSVRLPSALAVGLAAAGVVVLASRLGSHRAAVIAGIAFSVLPRTTYMGSEARSYALGTARAVWLTVLLVRLVSQRTRSRVAWLAYAVLFAVSIYVFLYLILLAAVYAVTLFAYARDRSLLLRWLFWSVLGVVLAAPVIAYAIGQRNQISFLGTHPGVSLTRFLVSQWFSSDLLALAAWLTIAALVAASIVLNVRSRHRGLSAPESSRSRSLEMGSSLHGEHASRISLLGLALAWFVLPPLILFAANLFVPLYTIRYMSFVTPAIGILLALAIDAVTRRRRWLVVVAVAALFALTAPSYFAQRGPYAKNGGSDWAEVAQMMGQRARSGDSVVFDETARPSRRPRLAMHLYPEDFANLTDVTLKSPYNDNPGLWDSTISITQAAPRIAARDGRVWLVEYRGVNKAGIVSSIGMDQRFGELRALGYTVDQTFTLHRDNVYLLTKGARP